MSKREGFDTSRTIGELCSIALRRLTRSEAVPETVMDPFVAEKLLGEGLIERAGGSHAGSVRLTLEGRETAEAERRARQALRRSRKAARSV